ncbi:MAG: hypothetical protein WBQ94_03480 [Terracidiphilus sp.]
MPNYVNNPFSPAPLLQVGVPTYFWGSRNFHQANTKAFISQVALTSNVATVTVQIVEGEIPVAGSLISIQQTASTTGLFNVNRAALTSATIDGNGAGTFVFPLTHANVAAVANTGTAIVEVPEVAEALANGASQAIYVQQPMYGGQRTLTISVTFPSLPTTCNVTLQKAINNIDSEFTNVGTPLAAVATGAQSIGPVSSVTLEQGNFYRLNVASVAGGTSPTIIAKLL